MTDGHTVSTARGQLRPATSWRGPGRYELVKIAAPPTGAGFTRPTPADFWERILGVVFTFNTSATSGSRQMQFALQDGDGFTFNVTPLFSAMGPNQVMNVILDRDGTPANQAPTALNGHGSVTTPAANTNIASSPTVQPGEWTLYWTVELEGTPAAGTDNDNFALFSQGNLIETSVNQAAVGVYPQLSTNVETNAATTFNVKSVGAGTAGAIYVADIVAVPVGQDQSYGQLPDMWMKSGWQSSIQIIDVQAGDAITNLAYLVERVPSSDIYQVTHRAEHELAELLLAYLRGA